MNNLLLLMCFSSVVLAPATASAQPRPPVVSTPMDVKPGSITCEDVPYPYPVSYLPLTLYGQDARIAFMDVPPLGQANGHTVVLFHGNNFAAFYFGTTIDALRQEGFRVIAPDPPEPEDRQGRDRGAFDGRHARRALCHAVFPNGNGRLHLIPGLGHGPHMEAPGQTLPPLVAFLKEGLARR